MTGLQPETLYRFALRAWNQYGASAPSDITEPVLTWPIDHQPITQYELVEARKFLESDVLSLKQVISLNSTSLKVIWDVCLFMILY